MELRRVAPVVGLVVLLAADVVLIGWAFRPAPSDGYVSAGVTTTQSPTPRPSKSAAVQIPQVKPAPVEQFITAVGPTTAWVVRAGSCANPGGVWVTGDKGDSWTRNGIPARMTRLVTTSEKQAFGLGGAGTKCDLQLWKSTDSGADWGAPGDASGRWARMPNDAFSVHTPSDQVKRPCGPRAVIDLAVLDAKRAEVICDNGDLRATVDGGTRWDKVQNVPDALALTISDGGGGVVVVSDKTCQGVRALPITSGVVAKDGECVNAPTQAGHISVSTAGANVWWLLVGPQIYTAEDPAGPWNQTVKDAAG